MKIIKACKEAELPEPEITEMNGGVEVTLFNNLQTPSSGKIRDDFGTISERIALGAEKNTGYLRGIFMTIIVSAQNKSVKVLEKERCIFYN